METCKTCRDLLSNALDLCVRARKMDAMDRRQSFLSASVCPEEWQASGLFEKWAAQYNVTPENAHVPVSTKSATVAVWLQDQYERDLFAWEASARQHLMQGCEHQPRKDQPHE